METKFEIVDLPVPSGLNVIVGQSHFIKTVEDIAEIMANSIPGTLGGAKYGLAFNEASEPCLVRTEGTEEVLVKAAAACALAVGAGHSFYLILGNLFPVNILDRLKACPEVCGIFCATANPVQVVVATSAQGRGIMGVIDGSAPKGVEGPAEKAERKGLLRRFGYKF
ncbi:MAG: adenosine monophosphate-protein transferase [Treponema sp. GWB1_62_6]|nr:MAG: adenosine monophosphate-protein transferase [Treponema sp. GWA1_62_8]OHE68627.1 MAG: adenosine monophosphate-protein transferase [Treponema sp. GWC1_61_84]OHE70390.1 MAG: adenosine monophosphate-protein transferase [Treponema sp. RIFOXYC1_FULL_61_9]OHE71050.1 MAG: adenosine monophosphate-protein transferase [Treponema sp. GWB1_62_6]HCM26578.1 adenosine monophosphate-protein transferase [Treponema sp.]